MKRKFRVTYILMFVFVLTFSIISLSKNVKANSQTKLSDYVEAITEREETDLIGGVKLYKQSVKSYWDGVTGNGERFESGTVQWVDLPGDNEEVKIVTWSQGTKDNFRSSTVRKTAEDYEKAHPGWIVVAAVNGDFFQINSTYEALGLMVQDGDVIRSQQHSPYSPFKEMNDGVLGWDDQNKLYVGYPQMSTTMSLQIRNENGEYDKEFAIAGVNTEIKDKGITLITKDKGSATNFEGATVYVGEYELNRISNAGKVFVKGSIKECLTDLGVAEVPFGKFYLVSKDGSLDSILSSDTYVRCQYNLTGEWSNVTSAIRYYHMLLENGEHKFYRSKESAANNVIDGKTINDYDLAYGLSDKARCVIGFKEDGSTVMMVADGRGKAAECAQSMSYFQVAEMMRIAGCKDVYQMDGGGSATLIARNANGHFDVINRPSDGSERSIGNAILFVMRDPGLKVDVKNNTRTSITIIKEQTNISSLVEDIKITVDGKTHSMAEDLLVIEGLKESTEYLVHFAYTIPDFKDPNKKVKGGYTTVIRTRDFIYPSSGLEVSKIEKNSITITKAEAGYEDWIQNVSVYVSGKTYYMGSETTLVIDELLDDTKYVIYFEYDIIEPGNPKVYHNQESTFEIQTLAFSMPIFEEFLIKENTESSVKISYKYDDEDDICQGAAIVAYNEKGKEVSRQVITKKRGNVEFTGLDLTAQSYTFKIEILYYERETSTLLSQYYSEGIIAQKIEPVQKPKKGCLKGAADYMVATISVASLAILVFRKKK